MTTRWPRPPVIDRIPRSGDAVIEASAGTGKTYTLEHLVIDLVLRDGLPLDRILVVTFTEKAAAELAARLRAAMNRILQAPNTDEVDGEYWTIDETARRRLTRALTTFDAASISTIHAFCQRVLNEYAFVNGRLFQETLVDGRAIFQEAFLTATRRQLATDPELQPYITAWLQQASLDALADRLYEAHTRRGTIVPPFAPEPVRRALMALARMELTPSVLKPTLQRAGFRPQTIQAVLNRIKALRTVLEAFHRAPDVAAALAALDRENRARRKEGGLFAYVAETLRPVADAIPRLAELLRAMEQLDGARVSLESATVQMALPVVQDTLHREKRTSGRFDFDDMLRLVEAALEGSGREPLLRALRQRFQVALIDEFQDTDSVQWSVFRQVFADSPSHRLIVIGDPKQAIYGFRGADVRTYLEARAHLTRTGAPTVHLTESYRATPALIGAINALLDQTQPLPFFTGDIRYDHPVRAAGAAPVVWRNGEALAPLHIFRLKPKRDHLSPSAAHRTLHDRHRLGSTVSARDG